MTATFLSQVEPRQVVARRDSGIDPETQAAATAIVADVREGGEAALRAHGERLGDLLPGAPLVLGRDDFAKAFAALDEEDRALLERVAARVRRFAEAQRSTLTDLDVEVLGGRAGHRWRPVERAGCYAPGGRFPLPSSVLMTAVTARSAGVRDVWVASPRPVPVTLAAAHVAGADGLLAVGGAQAIAAFAYGSGPVPACDVIVGPGNAWVTAAKRGVFGDVGLDMLAGPSELVVVADETADPDKIAADLLAQAEHDPEARPILIALAAALPAAVEDALRRQLVDLPTADIAKAALRKGFVTVANGEAEAAELCDRLAPEHLSLQLARTREVAERVDSYGALFVGEGAAESFGDYGVGPNHVLPTGGTARYQGALSVATFLRCQTWQRMDGEPCQELVADSARLARLEGLEAHARAAESRSPSG